ncbi:hypothetical protein [Paraburkholderia phenoliruptrix]|uniref:hypothetical protein n=1 Tax=Paraburkholderia phenoliruptrix TaxID=252970 RepID=UPI002869BFDF|nr:hypothetical protein [Paraburkholderia phenoliruptrix]WMY08661.1 hypothetical protein P3F88_02465 [Paraburkholderia phenoliruptrix]
MKARDFLWCAVAVPALYLLFRLLELAWVAVVAVFEFFAATATNPASFSFVCFVLTVLSGGCAIAVYRQLEDNRPWTLRSWKEWRENQYENLRWYAVAIGGVVAGALQTYMVLTMPAAPGADTFRAWISIVGFVAGLGCLVVIPTYLGMSLWTLWRDRPAPAVQR